MLLTAATFTTHSLHAAIVCAFFFFILILSLTAPTNGLKGYSFPIRASKFCNPSQDRIPPMDHLKISPSLSSASLLLLTRVKPLFTVGNNNNLNPIPRLELGLRLLKSYALPITISKINIHPFPLDYLYHYEPMVQQTSNDANHCLSALSNMGKLFSSITHKTQSFVSGMVVRYLKRVVSATIILASSLSSVVMPGPMMLPPSGGSHLSALRRSVLVASPMMSVMMIGPRLVANAGVLKPYSRLTPTEKLSTTPLYFVSNSRGNAYLQEDVQGAQPDQKVVTYFMSSEDANHFLNEMAQVNQHSPNEFRLMTVSMEKIVNQIQTRKQSRKLGRYKMDLIYRIQPSSRQFENAEQILAGGSTKADVKATNANRLLKGINIPMFSTPGLTMKRPNGELVTPYYFAYEDLIDDWNKLPVAAMTGSSKNSKQESKKSPKTAAATKTPPFVIVTDFAEVMCLAQGITQSSIASSSSSSDSPRPTSDQIKQILQHTGIVPPRREIEMIKRFYRNQAGRKNEFSKSKLNL